MCVDNFFVTWRVLMDRRVGYRLKIVLNDNIVIIYVF